MLSTVYFSQRFVPTPEVDPKVCWKYQWIKEELITANRYLMCFPTIKNTVFKGMRPSVDNANLDSSVSSIHTIFG